MSTLEDYLSLRIQDCYYDSNTYFNRDKNLYHVYLFYYDNELVYVHYGQKGTEEIHYTSESPCPKFRKIYKENKTHLISHHHLTKFSVLHDCLFYVDFLINKFKPKYNKKIELLDETVYNKQIRFTHTPDEIPHDNELTLLYLFCLLGYPLHLISDYTGVDFEELGKIKNREGKSSYHVFCFEYVNKQGFPVVDKALFNHYCNVVFKTDIARIEELYGVAYF